MENKKINIHFGIEFIVFVILLMLKLDGIIDWKWICIFSPLWAVWFVQVITGVVTLLVIAISNAITASKSKSKRNCTYGEPLVWDAKTNTLYGPYMAEENENGN